MGSIFNLEESERSNLLQQIMGSFGFTYVCLWSHFPHQANYLIFLDGFYKEENNIQAMRSFFDYQKSMFLLDNYYSGRVPGLAFMHNLTYIKYTGLELLELASNPAQLHFYQEASIKTAIFMGCKNGEIELGMSNDSSQVNFEFELKKLLPGDFPQVLLQPLDQTRASSSSSSLRSLSFDNNVDSPFLFNMLQTSSNVPEIISGFKAPNLTASSSKTTRLEDPLQQALTHIRNNHLISSREHEEAAMTRAILAAISSPHPPSSSHQFRAPRAGSAFKKYQTYLGPIRRVHNCQNLNRRSLSFIRSLSVARAQQQDSTVYMNRPTSNQLHHMISERKRREKFNEIFQDLRSLLPPGSKKDKTSVLLNTKEYIDSLKSQVEELYERNKILEADQHSRKEILNPDSGERLNIRMTDVDESTSDSRGVELEVNVQGNSILNDLVVGVLEFMNQDENVTITSIDARTLVSEAEATTNLVVLRLRIQGSEWDRSSFLEALTRVLNDLAR